MAWNKRWTGPEWFRAGLGGESGLGVYLNALLVFVALPVAGFALGESTLGDDSLGAGLLSLGLLILFGVFLLYRIIVPAFRASIQARRQLQENLRHTELMLKYAGEGIYGMDAEGRAIFVNAAAERMLGYTAAEIAGRPIHDLIHHTRLDGTPHPAGECPAHLAISAGMTIREEVDVFWRKDGRRLDVSYVVAPVIEDGQVTAAVMLFDDITERRRAEAGRQAVETRLRESEANLERAQAQASLGSWVIDIPNNLLEWSQETHRIFGVPTGSAMTYEFFLGRVHPDDRAFVDAEWQAALRGQPYDIQHRLLADGQVKWVRERAELEFQDDGSLRRVVGTTQDITLLKLKEEELLRSRQTLRELAAHSDRIREIERTRIAREIHDELGQYLTALRMDVAMLNIRYGGDNPGLADQANAMKETIDTTIGVVRQVAAALRPGALDMGLVSAAEWLLTNFQERTGVHYYLEAPSEEPGLDDDRTTAVFRILQESLTNIARHAQAGTVTVSLAQDGGELCMQVEDDGVGFDSQEVRLKKTFGLMGIRERAIAFGGESRLDSRPGAGTTLTVRIPLESPPAT